LHAHLICDDARQGRFAETWRAEDECVIERLTPTFGRGKKNLHLLSDSGLTDVIIERLRSDRAIEGCLAVISGTSSD
jgi:hypothetical protein